MILRYLTILCSCLTLLSFGTQADETVQFTPPEGWLMAKGETLPTNVQVMVVGKGGKEFPPSINLSTEEFGGSVKDYLKIVKSINEAHGAEWKDLGPIITEAGEGSLSQVDTQTEWGAVKMMHVILVRDGVTYILTAAALRDEFPKFYKDFFRSLRSLRFNEASVTN